MIPQFNILHNLMTFCLPLNLKKTKTTTFCVTCIINTPTIDYKHFDMKL